LQRPILVSRTGGGWRRAGLALLLAGLACSTTPLVTPLPERTSLEPDPTLIHVPLDPTSVTVEPEGLSVESSFILKLYTWLHRRDHSAYRVSLPAAKAGADPVIAHLLLPPGEGPHQAVVVFPILAGSHVVSEGLAKALVNRGFAVARLERRALDLETAEEPDVVARDFSASIREARRLLDWLVTHPEIDRDRIAAGGVSLGGMLSCVLYGVDERIRAGLFIMSGGGLAEILYDSAEKPVRLFRDRLLEARGDASREAFVRWMRGYTEPVDPLRYAPGIPSESVLLITGRFDRVIPPERSAALHQALGEPTWIRIPTGHYQLGPFFWWAVGRGADHLEQFFAEE
jgi:dienelactone hydrolase